jgi:hypothetical protein
MSMQTGAMHLRTVQAAGIALAGVGAALAWLWIGPGSHQPCRPAPPWDDVAVWLSQSLGAGETDGPAGVPASCEIPTDFTWIIALGIFTVALTVAGYVLTGRRSPVGGWTRQSSDLLLVGSGGGWPHRRGRRAYLVRSCT